MLIQFHVPGVARGKGRHRTRIAKTGGGKQFVHQYTPKETAQYENRVAVMAAQAMQGKPPLEGPVSLVLQVGVIVPASWSQKKRAQALSGALYPTGKPDLDNIEKAIADACNKIVFRDDSQVCFVHKVKKYSETPGVFVTIATIEQVPHPSRLQESFARLFDGDLIAATS